MEYASISSRGAYIGAGTTPTEIEISRLAVSVLCIRGRSFLNDATHQRRNQMIVSKNESMQLLVIEYIVMKDI